MGAANVASAQKAPHTATVHTRMVAAGLWDTGRKAGGSGGREQSVEAMRMASCSTLTKQSLPTCRQALGALHPVCLKVEAGVKHILLGNQPLNQQPLTLHSVGGVVRAAGQARVCCERNNSQTPDTAPAAGSRTPARLRNHPLTCVCCFSRRWMIPRGGKASKISAPNCAVAY